MNKPTKHLDTLREQKRLESKARTEQLELANKEKRRELVTMETARKVITDVFLPLKSAFMAMPASLCVRCNPSDPEMARKAIDESVKEILQNASDAAARV